MNPKVRLDLIPFSPSRLDTTLFLYQNKNLFIKSKKILDAGCGKLFFFNILNEFDFNNQYLGVDLNPGKPNRKATFKYKIQKKDLQKIKPKQQFDCITCFWVLEHIRNDQKALNLFNKLVKKNGIVLVSVPSLWSWPFEFGRHGFHYYTKKRLLQMVETAGFKIINLYESGGMLGLLFMLLYSWPRYLILVLSLPIYFFLKFLKPNISWQSYSVKLIRQIMYKYHSFPIGLKVHNQLVKRIVELDNKFKIFPASYSLVLKNKK